MPGPTVLFEGSFPNLFDINDAKNVLLDHLIRSIDIPWEVISTERYYQHGNPAGPLFGVGSNEFVYIADEFTVFRDDQLAQMAYIIEDENFQTVIVTADSLVAVGPPLWTSRMRQEHFIVRNFPTIANIDYWEFVGWRIGLRPKP